MSQSQLEIHTPLPRISRRLHSDLQKRPSADVLQHIRALPHYIPDYDYRPDLYQYTETHTTDPDYVVLGVGMMSPTYGHSEALNHVDRALNLLIQMSAATLHVSREVNIMGIPGSFFASVRHTSTLQPDLAVWTGPPPPRSHASYRYDRDGTPLLAVEVASHSDRSQRDNDWHKKMFAYASMGIREYWIVDEQQWDPLQGFSLDAADGAPHILQAYRPIAAGADGGRDSMVLDASLRWVEDDIQCWHEEQGKWVRVADIPLMQARSKGRTEGRIEGELKTWSRMLHRMLDAAAPGAADAVLQHWATAVPSTWPSDETLDRLVSTPEAWRHLLLGEPHSDNGDV